jgi:glycosyltransferase involved in cell wall biosynthesis
MSDTHPAAGRRLLYICFERLLPSTAAATHVREICRGLETQGFSVTLKADEFEATPAWAERCARYFRVLIGSLRSLRKSDIVFFRAHFAAFPLALLVRLLGRPAVHEVNGVYEDAFVTHPRFALLRGMLCRMQRAQYRWSSALVAVTPDLVSWAMREAGHSNVFLVTNAANTAIFNPDGPHLSRSCRYVVFFGGLVRWHGVDVMMEAARSSAWPKDVELLIAGPVVDESLGPALEQLPPAAKYLGRRPQTELPPLVRGAFAALVPISDPGRRSGHGVMPLKMFEALACGTPVIVSDLPGQAEFIRNHRCGIVVPVADPLALAGAVAELAGDESRARELGRAGAKVVLAEHSWSARAAELARVMRQMLNRPQPARPETQRAR